MSLYALEAGTGRETVVLIHGFAGSHAAWREVQPLLAGKYRTIAYDMPGHAASLDWPGAGPAKVAARAILADLAERGISGVHVVGHSMGGAVAVLMALFEPGRVASLTLCAPGGFGPQINGRLLGRYASATDAADLRDCLEQMTGWYGTVTDSAVADAVAQRAIPGQRDLLLEIRKGMTRDGRQGEIPREEIARITVPVTLVWGRLDNVLPAFHTEGLPARFDVRLLDDVGHMLPEEAPRAVADAVAETVETAVDSGDPAPPMQSNS